MSVPLIIFEILLNCFDAAFFMSIMTKKLSVKPWVRKIHIAFFYTVIVIFFCFINFSTEFSTISFLLFPIVHMIYSLVFFEDSFFKKFFWLVFPHMIVAYVELFSILIAIYINDMNFGDIFFNSEYRFIWITIVKSIEIILWFILLKKESSNTHLKSLNTFTIVCIVSLISVSLMFVLNNQQDLKTFNLQKMMSLTLLLSITALLLCFYDFKENYKEKLDNLEGEIKQNQLESSWKIINAYKGVRHFRNNLEFKISKPEVLKSNIDTKLSDYRIGDTLADAVLAVKEAEAYDLGIEIKPTGHIPSRKTVSSENICVILDHLLSNSIENISIINDDDIIPEIELTFLDLKNGFSVYIGNPVNQLASSINMSSIENILINSSAEMSSDIDSYYNSTLVYFPYIGIK